MTKIIINNDFKEGVQTATAVVQFNLGKVSDKRTMPENVMLVAQNIDGMEKYFKQLLFEKGGMENSKKDFDEFLETYVGLRINQMIGIKSTPLHYEKDGQLVGLADEIEVVEEFSDKLKENE